MQIQYTMQAEAYRSCCTHSEYPHMGPICVHIQGFGYIITLISHRCLPSWGWLNSLNSHTRLIKFWMLLALRLRCWISFWHVPIFWEKPVACCRFENTYSFWELPSIPEEHTLICFMAEAWNLAYFHLISVNDETIIKTIYTFLVCRNWQCIELTACLNKWSHNQ